MVENEAREIVVVVLLALEVVVALAAGHVVLGGDAEADQDLRRQAGGRAADDAGARPHLAKDRPLDIVEVGVGEQDRIC